MDFCSLFGVSAPMALLLEDSVFQQIIDNTSGRSFSKLEDFKLEMDFLEHAMGKLKFVRNIQEVYTMYSKSKGSNSEFKDEREFTRWCTSETYRASKVVTDSEVIEKQLEVSKKVNKVQEDIRGIGEKITFEGNEFKALQRICKMFEDAVPNYSWTNKKKILEKKLKELGSTSQKYFDGSFTLNDLMSRERFHQNVYRRYNDGVELVGGAEISGTGVGVKLDKLRGFEIDCRTLLAKKSKASGQDTDTRFEDVNSIDFDRVLEKLKTCYKFNDRDRDNLLLLHRNNIFESNPFISDVQTMLTLLTIASTADENKFNKVLRVTMTVEEYEDFFAKLDKIGLVGVNFYLKDFMFANIKNMQVMTQRKKSEIPSNRMLYIALVYLYRDVKSKISRLEKSRV